MNKDSEGYKEFLKRNEFKPNSDYQEVWNNAIESAAEKIKEQYDHFGDAVIRHYKPMWIEEIRKLKI
jgi:hypothetical protein